MTLTDLTIEQQEMARRDPTTNIIAEIHRKEFYMRLDHVAEQARLAITNDMKTQREIDSVISELKKIFEMSLRYDWSYDEFMEGETAAF